MSSRGAKVSLAKQHNTDWWYVLLMLPIVIAQPECHGAGMTHGDKHAEEFVDRNEAKRCLGLLSARKRLLVFYNF
uniref:Putative secreted protein n=1 Tax=Anopheles darlingi TaxID=43151 RepID=A0A2M4D3Z4_ANODA